MTDTYSIGDASRQEEERLRQAAGVDISSRALSAIRGEQPYQQEGPQDVIPGGLGFSAVRRPTMRAGQNIDDYARELDLYRFAQSQVLQAARNVSIPFDKTAADNIARESRRRELMGFTALSGEARRAALATRGPVLRDFYANPSTARLAADDVENLSVWEMIGDVLRMSSFSSGADNRRNRTRDAMLRDLDIGYRNTEIAALQERANVESALGNMSEDESDLFGGTAPLQRRIPYQVLRNSRVGDEYRPLTAAERNDLELHRVDSAMGLIPNAKLDEDFGGWFLQNIVPTARAVGEIPNGMLRGGRIAYERGVALADAAARTPTLADDLERVSAIIGIPLDAAVSGATGAVIAPIAFSYQQEAGNALLEFRDYVDENGNPLDERVAGAYARDVGTLNAAIEIFNFAGTMRALGVTEAIGSIASQPVRSAFRRYTVGQGLRRMATGIVGEAAIEGGTEAVQEASIIALGEMARLDSSGVWDGLSAAQKAERMFEVLAANRDRLWEAGVGGAIIGGAIGSVVVPLTIGSIIEDARVATMQRNLIDAIRIGAEESKLKDRAPGLYEQVVKRAVSNTKIELVTINVEDFVGAFNQDENIARGAAREMGLESEFDAAIKIGGDLPIPMEKIARHVAGTDRYDYIAQHMRLSPDAPTIAEAQARIELGVDIERSVAAVEAHREEMTAIEDAKGKIRASFFERMQASGTFSQDEMNEAYSDLFAEAYLTLARASGMDVSKMPEMPDVVGPFGQRVGVTGDVAFDANLNGRAQGGAAISYKNSFIDKATVIFSERRDASTPIHEIFGHYFLEVMRFAAAQESASEVLKADWAALTSWLNITDEQWAFATQQSASERKLLLEPAHEKFARAVEAYFLEGVAPTPRLKNIFRAFKRWIVFAYRKILNSEGKHPLYSSLMDDTIRPILDRMFATQQEIAEAASSQGSDNILTRDQWGSVGNPIADAAYERYKNKIVDARRRAEELVDTLAIKALAGEVSRERRQAEVRARNTVKAEMEQHPAWIANDVLTGKVAPAGMDLRLNSASTYSLYPELADSLPAGTFDTDVEGLVEMALAAKAIREPQRFADRVRQLGIHDPDGVIEAVLGSKKGLKSVEEGVNIDAAIRTLWDEGWFGIRSPNDYFGQDRVGDPDDGGPIRNDSYTPPPQIEMIGRTAEDKERSRRMIELAMNGASNMYISLEEYVSPATVRTFFSRVRDQYEAAGLQPPFEMGRQGKPPGVVNGGDRTATMDEIITLYRELKAKGFDNNKGPRDRPSINAELARILSIRYGRTIKPNNIAVRIRKYKDANPDDVFYQENDPSEIEVEKRMLRRSPDNFNEAEQEAWDAWLATRSDAKDLLARLEQHKGTPWATQAIEGVFVRAALQSILSGSEPMFESALDSRNVIGARTAIERNGIEGLWGYLEYSGGMLGEASKPVNNVNSSFINCNPTRDCAVNCYATGGRYRMSNVITKSELVTYAIELDPVRSARQIAREYKNTLEFANKKALRLFDKGDGNASWIPFIEELNKQGIRVQIFTKNVEFARAVPSKNLVLLSIDWSNVDVADANTDMKIAFVYSGQSDLEALSRFVARDQVGVILPIKIGRRVMTQEEIAPIREIEGASKVLCPIDSGIRKIGNNAQRDKWNCTKCDKNGGVGCFFGSVTKDVLNSLEATTTTQSERLRSALQMRERVRASLAGIEAGVADAATGREGVDTGLLREMDDFLGELLRQLENSDRNPPSGRRTDSQARLDEEDGGDPFFQVRDERHSDLSLFVAGANVASPPASQWIGIIGNSGVPAEEIEWSGVVEWLRSKGDEKVSKVDVLRFVQEKGLRIETTVLGLGNEDPEIQKELLPLIEERQKIWNAKQQSSDLSLMRAATKEPRILNAIDAVGRAQKKEEDLLEETLSYGAPWVVSEDEWSWTIAVPSSQRRVSKADYERRGVQGAITDIATIENNRYREASVLRGQMWSDYQLEVLDHLNRLSDRITELKSRASSGKAKWSSYTLPGGENYNEVLLWVPPPDNAAALSADDYTIREQSDGFLRFSVYRNGSERREAFVPSREQAEEYIRNEVNRHLNSQYLKETFRSSHWDKPNVITHIRLNERVDANNRRTLFIEELQSDWHQAGRDRGYRIQDPEKEAELSANVAAQAERLDRAEAALAEKYKKITQRNADRTIKVLIKTGLSQEEIDAERKSIEASIDRMNRSTNGDLASEAMRIFRTYEDVSKSEISDLVDEVVDARARTYDAVEALRIEREKPNTVPNAPFKNNAWAYLGIKEAIRVAVSRGIQQIAWIKGQHAVDRFNLSTMIERISWGRREDGNYDITATRKDNGPSISRDNQSPADLAELVGHDVAKLIIEDQGTAYGTTKYKGGPRIVAVGEVSGQDLRIGGHGMRAFYDRILPNIANDLGKKYGVRTGETEIDTRENPWVASSFQEALGRVVDLSAGPTRAATEERLRVNAGYTDDDIAKVSFRKEPGESVHSLTITPEMFDEVLNYGVSKFGKKLVSSRAVKSDGMFYQDNAVDMFDFRRDEIMSFLMNDMSVERDDAAKLYLGLLADHNKKTANLIKTKIGMNHLPVGVRSEALVVAEDEVVRSTDDILAVRARMSERYGEQYVDALGSPLSPDQIASVVTLQDIENEIAERISLSRETDLSSDAKEQIEIELASLRKARDFVAGRQISDWSPSSGKSAVNNATDEQVLAWVYKSGEVEVRRPNPSFSVDEKDWSFVFKTDPSLKNPNARLSFSLNHKGEWVGITTFAGRTAASDSVAIGDRRPSKRQMKIAHAFFGRMAALTRAFIAIRNPERIVFTGGSDSHDNLYPVMMRFIEFSGYTARARDLRSGMVRGELLEVVRGLRPSHQILGSFINKTLEFSLLRPDVASVTPHVDIPPTAVSEISYIARMGGRSMVAPNAARQPGELFWIAEKTWDLRNEKTTGVTVSDPLGGSSYSGVSPGAVRFEPIGLQSIHGDPQDAVERAAKERAVRTLDEAEGWFYQEPQGPTKGEFVDALREDVSGVSPRYRSQDESAVQDWIEAQRVRQFFRARGVDISAKAKDIRKQIELVADQLNDRGVSADEMAAAVNKHIGYQAFGSGQEMLEAVVALPERKKYIRDRINALVADEMGDPIDEMKDVSKAAMHNVSEEQRLLMELAAIKEAANPGLIYHGKARPNPDASIVQRQEPSAPEVVITSWGDSLQAMPGRDYILSNDKGERWVIRRDIFDNTYIAVQGGFKKDPNYEYSYYISPDRREIVSLEKVKGKPTIAERGDYVMTGSVGEQWKMAPEEFKKRYIPVSPPRPRQSKGNYGATRAINRTVEEYAARRISLMTVKQVSNPDWFLSGERRWSKKAIEAVERGDYVAAEKAKFNQLIHFHLYKLARVAAAEMTRAQAYFRKLQRPSIRERIDASYIEQIDAILEDYEIRNISRAQAKRNMSLVEWVDDMKARGLEAMIQIDPKIIARANKKPFSELNIDDARAIRDAVKNIEHLGRMKDRMLRQKEQRDFNTLVSSLITQMEATGPVKKQSRNYSASNWEAMTDGARRLHSELTRMEFLFRYLDGGVANGPLWNALYRPFAEAADKENSYQLRVAAQLDEAWRSFSSRERQSMFRRKISVPQLAVESDVTGTNDNFTKAELIAIALNVGNTGNVAALVDGFGWFKTDAITGDYATAKKKIVAVLDNHLTDRDWSFVQRVWDIVGQFRDEAFDVHQRLTGLRPEAVAADPVSSKHGSYAGGYYPLKFDPLRDARVERADAKENSPVNNWGASAISPMTKKGHLIERTGSGGRPVRLSLDVMGKHLADVVHDISYREALIDVNKITNDSSFRAVFIRVAGEQMQKQLQPWLHSIAGSVTAREPLDNVARILRGNMQVAVMGMKIATSLTQITGLLQSATMVGGPEIAGQVAKLATRPHQLMDRYEFVTSRSSFMKTRWVTRDRDVRSFLTRAKKDGGIVGAHDFVQRNSFHLIGIVDMVVSVVTWLAAYEKAKAGRVRNIDGGIEEDAIAYADSVVRQTQSAGLNQDLPAIMRGGEWGKLATGFYSYFSVLYNFTAYDTILGVRKGRVPYLIAAGNFFLIYCLAPVLTELLAGRWEKEGEDDEDRRNRMLGIVARGMFSTIPLVRDMANAYDAVYDYRLTSFEGGVQSVVDTAEDIADGGIAESESSQKRAAMALGFVFGLPGAQAYITGDYVRDYMEGEETGFDFSEALVRDTR